MTRTGTTGLVEESVVVCTRNRPEGAAETVRSILRDTPGVELVVVDQSDDDSTAKALSAQECRSARVIRAEPRGLAAARNVGVSSTKGAVIAFTDDDCEVQPGWLTALRAAFSADERLALVFGVVAAPQYDRSAGFVPAYHVAARYTADRLGQKCRIEGMGACMAVRRAAWERLRGFDEALGTGAPMRSGEDTDFAVRALATGWHVGETPDAAVLHNGFRNWAQGRDLIAGYMYGLGAVNMKMFRLGRWRALRPLAELGWRWLAGAPVVDLNQRPPRLLRLSAFARGAFEGLRAPLDETGRFTPRR